MEFAACTAVGFGIYTYVISPHVGYLAQEFQRAADLFIPLSVRGNDTSRYLQNYLKRIESVPPVYDLKDDIDHPYVNMG